MLKIIVALALVVVARSAQAGPYCGRIADFAPAAETIVPVGATLAMFVEDHYYGGRRQGFASPSRIRATIDGVTVPISLRDVRVADGVIRYIKLESRKVGKLEIFVVNPWTKGVELGAEYTISKTWAEVIPTATIDRDEDDRLSPYRYLGQIAAVRLDAPAVGFTMKWRRSSSEAWRVLAVPASIEGWPSERKRTEARLGQTMCGMVENVPLSALEAGIEVELVAKLPNGRDVTVNLPSRIAIPPESPEARKRRQRSD